MKIAVMGGRGFIGSEICKVLSKGNVIIPITPDTYSDYFGETFDVFINANGSAKKFLAEEQKIEDFFLNVISVYKSLLDFKFKKYIYISTVDIEGKSTYGFHKSIAEEILRRYCKDLIILRCGTVIGKQMKKGFVYDLIHRFPLFISEYSRFHLITNTEIANVIRRLLKRDGDKSYYYQTRKYTLAGTDSVSVKDVAKILKVKPLYRDTAEEQIYKLDLSDIAGIYKLKTSEQYLKDIL